MILPKHKRSLLACVIAVAGAIAGPSVLHAQESQTTNSVALEEVVVTGVRASILRAIDAKRNSQGFSDSISAEDLGKFPDLNISESLQRVPGVTLNRNPNGEGEQINLRGLSPLFTRVEINGLTGLGNGSGADANKDGSLGTTGGGREFSFELLPAELFSTASIAKSASAAQSEGGLAGVVSLETPRALSHEGFKYTASAHLNYDSKSGSTEPRLFFAFSNNINDRFGISGAIYKADSQFQSDSIESGNRQPLTDVFDAVRTPGGDGAFGTADDVMQTLSAYASENPLDLNALAIKTPRAISFREERENIAGNLNLQFRPTEGVEIIADLLIAELSSEKDVVRPDAAIEGTHTLVIGPNNPFTTAAGLVTQATLDEVQYRPSTRQLDIEDKFVQLSLSADIALSEKWTVKPLLGYANRKAVRDHALLAFRANNTDGGNLDCSSATANAGCRSNIAHYLTYSGQGTDFDFQSDYTNFDGNPENFGLNVLIFRPSVDEDEETTFKLDFNRSFDDRALTSLDFGLRYNDKTKTVNFREYRLARTGGQPSDGFENVGTLVPHDVEGTSNSFNDQLLTPDPDRVFSYYFPNGFNEEASTGTLTNTRIDNRRGRGAQQSYEIEEETFNLYVSGDFEFSDKLNLNAGLRYVKTDQTSRGSRVEARDTANEVITPVTVENDYSEFLPSVSLRYEHTEEILLRAAYSTTLTRANLPQLSPFEQVFVSTVGADNGFINRGNPQLEPFTSDNFDLGAEWYFEEEGLLSVNVFYKDLSDFVGNEITRENTLVAPQVACTLAEIAVGLAGGGCDADGRASFNLRVTNPINAVSASIQGLEFGFQKPLGNDFGMLFNYTYADSSADFGAENDVREDGLPGLSKNSFNAGIYYDADYGDKGALEARLNYAWRDRYLAVFADDFTRPKFTEDYGQLDLSVSYSWGNFRTSLQLLNLTDENVRFKGFDSGVGFYDYGVHDTSQRVVFGVQYTN